MTRKRIYRTLTALLAVLLITALTACEAAAPAPELPAGPTPGSGISLAPEPAPEVPASQTDTPAPPEEPVPSPLEYRPPVEGVEGKGGSCKEDIWEWDLHYLVPGGTPVLCPLPGEIVEVSDHSVWPYGKYLLIQIREDTRLRISHLQELSADLKPGDRVERSAQIGLAGRTGNVDACVAGVALSRRNEAGEYQDLVEGEWEFLLAEPADRETLPEYTPPEGGIPIKEQYPSMSTTELLYRTGNIGVPVYSPVEGTVAELQSKPLWPYGRSVIVETEDGTRVRLTHIGEIEPSLQIGDSVTPETRLALSGTSGSVSWPAVGVVVYKKNRKGEYWPLCIGLWDTVFSNWSEKEFVW